MWICIFGYVEMHFWLCKDTGTMNRSPTPDGMFCNQFRGGRWELGSVSQPISWVLREHSPNVRHVFAICLIYIRKMFATCWLSVCYILTEQKGGFCIAKVWFLACKKGVFDGQK